MWYTGPFINLPFKGMVYDPFMVVLDDFRLLRMVSSWVFHEKIHIFLTSDPSPSRRQLLGPFTSAVSRVGPMALPRDDPFIDAWLTWHGGFHGGRAGLISKDMDDN